MDINDEIENAIKNMIVHELEKTKADVSEIKAVLGVTNQRIDDTNKRIDDISIHIADLSRRIDGTNNRIDELKDRIEDKISETNDRMNRLYEVIVRRDEHKTLELKVIDLERDVKEIKSKIAM